MMTTHQPRFARPPLTGVDGFTLVETMVSMIIFSLVGAMATAFMLQQAITMNKANEVAASHQNARAAMTRISGDIKVVGQGLNLYDIRVPDMIVPNDGTAAVGAFRDNAISLISIPASGNQIALDPVPPANGDMGATSVTVVTGADLTGLAPGERIVLFDPNTGNSQVLALTNINGLALEFTGDALVFDFPNVGSTPAILLKLNEVRYRLGAGPGPRFIERKTNSGPWVRYIEGIERLQFTYFDATGTPITPTTQSERRDIRRVGILVEAVQLRRVSGNERIATVALTTSVVPRNMLTP